MPSRDPHWRARLVEVQDLCLVAPKIDDALAGTVLHLVERLIIEGEERAALRALIGQAAALLTTPRSRADIAQWLDEAAPYLDAATGERSAELDALAPIDPRD